LIETRFKNPSCPPRIECGINSGGQPGIKHFVGVLRIPPRVYPREGGGGNDKGCHLSPFCKQGIVAYFRKTREALSTI
jgi:hypothetical protein